VDAVPAFLAGRLRGVAAGGQRRRNDGVRCGEIERDAIDRECAAEIVFEIAVVVRHRLAHGRSPLPGRLDRPLAKIAAHRTEFDDGPIGCP